MKSLLLRLTGVFLFFYLIFQVAGLSALHEALRTVSPLIFLTVIPLHLLQWFLRVQRCHFIIEDILIPLTFRQIFVITASGFFIGCMSPGRVGEMAKVKFLMNAGYPFRRALLSFLTERIMDILGLLFFVAFGWLACFALIPSFWFWSVPTGTGLFMLACLQTGFRRGVWRMALLALPRKAAELLNQEKDALQRFLAAIPRQRWVWIFVQSVLIWGLNCLMIYGLFESTRYTLSWGYGIAFVAFGSTAGLAPITLYGVGVREVVLIGLFQLAGYSPEAANTAAITLGIMYLVILLLHVILGFASWISPAMQPFLRLKNSAE